MEIKKVDCDIKFVENLYIILSLRESVTPRFHNAKRALFFFFSTNAQSAQNIFN
jgi:hypothetical protein